FRINRPESRQRKVCGNASRRLILRAAGPPAPIRRTPLDDAHALDPPWIGIENMEFIFRNGLDDFAPHRDSAEHVEDQAADRVDILDMFAGIERIADQGRDLLDLGLGIDNEYA